MGKTVAPPAVARLAQTAAEQAAKRISVLAAAAEGDPELVEVNAAELAAFALGGPEPCSSSDAAIAVAAVGSSSVARPNSLRRRGSALAGNAFGAPTWHAPVKEAGVAECIGRITSEDVQRARQPPHAAAARTVAPSESPASASYAGADGARRALALGRTASKEAETCRLGSEAMHVMQRCPAHLKHMQEIADSILDTYGSTVQAASNDDDLHTHVLDIEGYLGIRDVAEEQAVSRDKVIAGSHVDEELASHLRKLLSSMRRAMGDAEVSGRTTARHDGAGDAGDHVYTLDNIMALLDRACAFGDTRAAVVEKSWGAYLNREVCRDEGNGGQTRRSAKQLKAKLERRSRLERQVRDMMARLRRLSDNHRELQLLVERRPTSKSAQQVAMDSVQQRLRDEFVKEFNHETAMMVAEARQQAADLRQKVSDVLKKRTEMRRVLLELITDLKHNLTAWTSDAQSHLHMHLQTKSQEVSDLSSQFENASFTNSFSRTQLEDTYAKLNHTLSVANVRNGDRIVEVDISNGAIIELPCEASMISLASYCAGDVDNKILPVQLVDVPHSLNGSCVIHPSAACPFSLHSRLDCLGADMFDFDAVQLKLDAAKFTGAWKSPRPMRRAMSADSIELRIQSLARLLRESVDADVRAAPNEGKDASKSRLTSQVQRVASLARPSALLLKSSPEIVIGRAKLVGLRLAEWCAERTPAANQRSAAESVLMVLVNLLQHIGRVSRGARLFVSIIKCRALRFRLDALHMISTSLSSAESSPKLMEQCRMQSCISEGLSWLDKHVRRFAEETFNISGQRSNELRDIIELLEALSQEQSLSDSSSRNEESIIALLVVPLAESNTGEFVARHVHEALKVVRSIYRLHVRCRRWLRESLVLPGEVEVHRYSKKPRDMPRYDCLFGYRRSGDVGGSSDSSEEEHADARLRSLASRTHQNLRSQDIADGSDVLAKVSSNSHLVGEVLQRHSPDKEKGISGKSRFKHLNTEKSSLPSSSCSASNDGEDQIDQADVGDGREGANGDDEDSSRALGHDLASLLQLAEKREQTLMMCLDKETASRISEAKTACTYRSGFDMFGENTSGRPLAGRRASAGRRSILTKSKQRRQRMSSFENPRKDSRTSQSAVSYVFGLAQAVAMAPATCDDVSPMQLHAEAGAGAGDDWHVPEEASISPDAMGNVAAGTPVAARLTAARGGASVHVGGEGFDSRRSSLASAPIETDLENIFMRPRRSSWQRQTTCDSDATQLAGAPMRADTLDYIAMEQDAGAAPLENSAMDNGAPSAMQLTEAIEYGPSALGADEYEEDTEGKRQVGARYTDEVGVTMGAYMAARRGSLHHPLRALGHRDVVACGSPTFGIGGVCRDRGRSPSGRVLCGELARQRRRSILGTAACDAALNAADATQANEYNGDEGDASGNPATGAAVRSRAASVVAVGMETPSRRPHSAGTAGMAFPRRSLGTLKSRQMATPADMGVAAVVGVSAVARSYVASMTSAAARATMRSPTAKHMEKNDEGDFNGMSKRRKKRRLVVDRWFRRAMNLSPGSSMSLETSSSSASESSDKEGNLAFGLPPAAPKLNPPSYRRRAILKQSGWRRVVTVQAKDAVEVLVARIVLKAIARSSVEPVALLLSRPSPESAPRKRKSSRRYPSDDGDGGTSNLGIRHSCAAAATSPVSAASIVARTFQRVDEQVEKAIEADEEQPRSGHASTKELVSEDPVEQPLVLSPRGESLRAIDTFDSLARLPRPSIVDATGAGGGCQQVQQEDVRDSPESDLGGSVAAPDQLAERGSPLEPSAGLTLKEDTAIEDVESIGLSHIFQAVLDSVREQGLPAMDRALAPTPPPDSEHAASEHAASIDEPQVPGADLAPSAGSVTPMSPAMLRFLGGPVPVKARTIAPVHALTTATQKRFPGSPRGGNRHDRGQRLAAQQPKPRLPLPPPKPKPIKLGPPRSRQPLHPDEWRSPSPTLVECVCPPRFQARSYSSEMREQPDVELGAAERTNDGMYAAAVPSGALPSAGGADSRSSPPLLPRMVAGTDVRRLDDDKVDTESGSECEAAFGAPCEDDVHPRSNTDMQPHLNSNALRQKLHDEQVAVQRYKILRPRAWRSGHWAPR
eukprot:TRINITY_DN16520_c0_g5_i2.p1 TRINITY_DN16520_c0_g5~~TRINITY_DN16520_c0_g5_i2.p1  ORF type:complete len:2146 (-),score=343.79 TRINITY_DN16520_c0_g5_i2:121-6435(-)